MRAYADTSFLVRLVLNEAGSQAAMAEFRRLEFPPLYFLPLHALEVTNAIRQRAFHLRHTVPARERSGILRERDAALSRIERWLNRVLLVEYASDCDEPLIHARNPSERHIYR